VAAEVVLKALKHVWVSLEPFHAPMAVMGGLALAAWRHVRATRDVDLLIPRAAACAPRAAVRASPAETSPLVQARVSSTSDSIPSRSPPASRRSGPASES